MVDRRKLFRESKQTDHHHHPNVGGLQGYSTIWFLFSPFVLFGYVFISVQEREDYNNDSGITTIRKDDPIQSLYSDIPTDDETNTNNNNEDNHDMTTTIPPEDLLPQHQSSSSSSSTTTNIPLTGLWISVESWTDIGRFEWIQAFAEMIFVAQQLNAVLVEPDIIEGNLIPCGRYDGSMPLSNVYNRSLLLTNTNDIFLTTTTTRTRTTTTIKLATCSEYHNFQNKLTAPKIYDICFDTSERKKCFNTGGGDNDKKKKDEEDEDDDDKGWHTTDSFAHQKTIPILDQILEDDIGKKSSHSSIILLKFHNVGKSALNQLTIPSRTSSSSSSRKHPSIILLKFHNVGKSALNQLTIPSRTSSSSSRKRMKIFPKDLKTTTNTKTISTTEYIQQYLFHNMRFHQRYYDWVHSELKAKDIHSDYGMIHWNIKQPSFSSSSSSSSLEKASIKRMMKCAKYVLQAQQATMDSTEIKDMKRLSQSHEESWDLFIVVEYAPRLANIRRSDTHRLEDGQCRTGMMYGNVSWRAPTLLRIK